MDTIYLLDMEIRYREIIVKDRLIYLFYKSITLPVVLGSDIVCYMTTVFKTLIS